MHYTHVESGRTVTLIHSVKIKTADGDWQPGVVYRVHDNGTAYARPTEEFREKFKPVVDSPNTAAV